MSLATASCATKKDIEEIVSRDRSEISKLKNQLEYIDVEMKKNNDSLLLLEGKGDELSKEAASIRAKISTQEVVRSRILNKIDDLEKRLIDVEIKTEKIIKKDEKRETDFEETIIENIKIQHETSEGLQKIEEHYENERRTKQNGR